MSIIGYDCDGKPLKSGDAVVIVDIEHDAFSKVTGLRVGDVVRAIKPSEYYRDCVQIDVKVNGYIETVMASEHIRKVPPKQQHHEASNQSFRELMHGLGCDAGVTA